MINRIGTRWNQARIQIKHQKKKEHNVFRMVRAKIETTHQKEKKEQNRHRMECGQNPNQTQKGKNSKIRIKWNEAINQTKHQKKKKEQSKYRME
jgi:hypothetical protein